MLLVIRNVRANPDPDGVPAHDDLDAIQSRSGLGAVRVERPGAQLGSNHPCLFGRPVATNPQPPAPARFDDVPHPPANQVARSR